MKEFVEQMTYKKLTENFTDEFIQNHSGFESFEQMWEHDKSKLKDRLLFSEYVKTKEWNEFVKNNTEFDDYVGMEFASRIMGMKKGKRYWFSDD